MESILAILVLLFIAITLFSTWILSGYYISKANHDLKDYRGDGNDQDLHDASWYTLWATVITWLTFSLLIVLGIIVLIGGIFFSPEILVAVGASAEVDAAGAAAAAESSKKSKSGISKIVIILVGLIVFGLLILCSINTVLAFLALKHLVDSPQYTTTDLNLVEARKYIISSGLISISIVVTILTFIIAYIVSKPIKSIEKKKKENNN